MASIHTQAYRRLRRAVLASSRICHLCGEQIDLALRWPNPKSASADHVVPRSKGGTNHRANLKAAHLGCNASRGDQDLNTNASRDWLQR